MESKIGLNIQAELQADFNEAIAELKVLFDELNNNDDKANVVYALNGVVNNIVERNNIVEMKITYAKECLKDTHKCLYVPDSDTDNFIILSNEYGSISKICGGLVSFYASEFNTKPIDIPTSSFAFGPTCDLAWLDAYNKIVAVDKSKVK